MKVSYRIEGMCCPNCAEAMRRKVERVDGVSSADLVFMTRKLIITVPDDRAEPVLQKVEALIHDIMPKAEVKRL